MRPPVVGTPRLRFREPVPARLTGCAAADGLPDGCKTNPSAHFSFIINEFCDLLAKTDGMTVDFGLKERGGAG